MNTEEKIGAIAGAYCNRGLNIAEVYLYKVDIDFGYNELCLRSKGSSMIIRDIDREFKLEIELGEIK